MRWADGLCRRLPRYFLLEKFRATEAQAWASIILIFSACKELSFMYSAYFKISTFVDCGPLVATIMTL
jgi:hypothetical protein